MRRSIAAAALGLAVAAASAGPAAAQVGRTFVSGHGVDTGSCPPTAPCRSFAYAIGETTAGGEITILDPAGYGPVTIDKSISIVNDGVGEAGITVASLAFAIQIAAPAGDVVNLRGLTLVGSGVGAGGIQFDSGGAGATLNVQNCVIRGFKFDGIVATESVGATINISDTIVSNNGRMGMWLQGGGGGSSGPVANLTRVQAIGNGADGIRIGTGGGAATIKDSVAANNGGAGFAAYTTYTATEGPTVTMVVTDSVASNNQTGIYQYDAAAVYLSNVTTSGNTDAGWQNSMYSYQNNSIVEVSPNNGSFVTVPLQ